MKMVIVLDKICLIGVIAVSLSVGYKAGVKATEIKYAMKTVRERENG